MIPQTSIIEWRATAPWKTVGMVEQDLIISRAIVDIFNDPVLNTKVAFRGGTALHKLYLQPARRYSEDIDLVQVTPEPVGNTIDRFREVLAYLGKPARKQRNRNTTLIYRVESEMPPIETLCLKIEINCREHFTVYGYTKVPFGVESRWFTGRSNVITYSIEELLGSKMRALFQRKKGRDLFDLWYSYNQKHPDIQKILHSFDQFIRFNELTILKEEYIENVHAKINDPIFRNDITGLIHPDFDYDIDQSFEHLYEHLFSKMGDKIGFGIE